MAVTPWMARVELLWELPLSVGSFVFSRLLRAILQTLGRFYGPSRSPDPQWQIVSAEFLASPVKLLWAMTRARWNLHAVVAIAGPFEVNQSISLNRQDLHQSAPSWTVVVYTLPSYQTLASTSSLTVTDPNGWETLSLQPGRYLLGLRYYHWSDPISLPAIKVDQVPVVNTKTVTAPADINSFYRNLIQRKTCVHTSLNYYVFNLLRYRQWLPAPFVERVFLPVPNPETQFYYGALCPGESLHLELEPSLTTTHNLYFSLYNRDCFPLDWYPITASDHRTSPTQVKSIYLIRVHLKRPEYKHFEREWLTLTVVA